MLTLSDFQGLFVILLVVFIVISFIKKASKFALFCITILCLMQVGFMLSKTSINEKIPLDKYFKYDIVSSVSQIWKDTDKEVLIDDVESSANTVIEESNKLIKSLK